MELRNALVTSVSKIKGWYFAGYVNFAVQREIKQDYGGKYLQQVNTTKFPLISIRSSSANHKYTALRQAATALGC